jgi:hypothetical protein
MNKAASLAIGAGPGHPKGATDLCFVLGVAGDLSHLLFTVGKLALGAIAAATRLAPATAKLRLVQSKFAVVCTGASNR